MHSMRPSLLPFPIWALLSPALFSRKKPGLHLPSLSLQDQCAIWRFTPNIRFEMFPISRCCARCISPTQHKFWKAELWKAKGHLLHSASTGARSPTCEEEAPDPEGVLCDDQHGEHKQRVQLEMRGVDGWVQAICLDEVDPRHHQNHQR